MAQHVWHSLAHAQLDVCLATQVAVITAQLDTGLIQVYAHQYALIILIVHLI